MSSSPSLCTHLGICLTSRCNRDTKLVVGHYRAFFVPSALPIQGGIRYAGRVVKTARRKVVKSKLADLASKISDCNKDPDTYQLLCATVRHRGLQPVPRCRTNSCKKKNYIHSVSCTNLLAPSLLSEALAQIGQRSCRGSASLFLFSAFFLSSDQLSGALSESQSCCRSSLPLCSTYLGHSASPIASLYQPDNN
jgi:hypothetical protein